MATLRELLPGPAPTTEALLPSRPTLRVNYGPNVQAESDQAEAANMSQLRRGFTSGLYGSEANALAADMSGLRAAGDNVGADALAGRVEAARQRAATFAPAEQDVTTLGLDPGRMADYALGAIGQGAASMLEPAGAAAGLGVASRLTGMIPHPVAQGTSAALRLAAPAAAGYLNFRQGKGEFVQDAYADPEIVRTQTPQQINTAGNVSGALSGALDTILPGLAGERIAGRTAMRAMRQPGVLAKTGLDMAGEAATELGQGEIKRGTLGYLNPNRDTSGDAADRWNDLAGGALGAGPLSAVSNLAAKGHGRLAVADDLSSNDVSGKAAPKARESVTDILKRGASEHDTNADAEKWMYTLRGVHRDDDPDAAIADQHAALLKELSGRAAKGDTVAQQHVDALNAMDPADPVSWLGSTEREAAFEHILGDGTDHAKVIAAYKGRKLNEQGDSATAKLAASVLRDALPAGAAPELHRAASDVARTLSTFADKAEGRGALADPLLVMETAQKIADLYPGKTAAALVAKVATAAGVETTPLFRQLQKNLAAAGDILATKKSGRMARVEAGAQLVTLISPTKQLELRKDGIDLTSPGFQSALLGLVQNASSQRLISLNKTFGAEAVKAMTALVAPGKVVEQEKTTPAENGGEKTAAAKESDDLKADASEDDWAVDGALKNVAAAPGSKLYAFKGRGLVGSTDAAEHPFEPNKKTGNLPVLAKLDDENTDGANTLEHIKAKLYETLGGEFGRITSRTTRPAAEKDQYGFNRHRLVREDMPFGAIKNDDPNSPSAFGVGSYRIRTVSAKEVMDNHNLPTSKRVKLMLAYLAKDGVKAEATASSLRDKLGVAVPEDANVAQMANAFFENRYLVTAEQMAEKDQLRLDHAEVRKMARRGNDDLDYSDLAKAEGNQAKMQADMNLIRFKSKHAVSKDGVAVMRASDLVSWVFKNRNEYKRDRNKGGAEVRAHEYRDALSEAIGALVADGYADEMPYMVNGNGVRESFADGFPPSLKLGGMTQKDLTRTAKERADAALAELKRGRADEEARSPEERADGARRVEEIRQERVARDQNKTETVRNTDPDELLDDGREAKRLPRQDENGEALPQDAARYWDAPRAETKDELTRRTVGGKALRVPKYPTAPETVDTRSDAMRVPSELERDEQTSGVPTERTDIAQRTAVLGSAEAGIETLTPTNAQAKAARLAGEVWAQFGTDPRGAFLRLQRLVAALNRPADPQGNALAGGRHYAAPLALLLTPERVAKLVASAKDAAKAQALLGSMRAATAEAILKAGESEIVLHHKVAQARALLGNPKLTPSTMKAPLAALAGAKPLAAKSEPAKADNGVRLNAMATRIHGELGHRMKASAKDGVQNPNYVIYDDSKITTNYVHFNAQAAQAPEAAAHSDDQIAKALTYIHKVLGPSIKVEVSKDFPNAGEYLDAEQLIKLSTAVGPGVLSVAYHEALHGQFARMVKNSPDAAKALTKVMSSPAMLERLNALLANEPAALAAIADGAQHAAEERVAYAYQFWAAGELDVDKPATTLFAKFRKMLRKVLGMVRDSEVALDIMTAMHDGKLAEPSAAGRVLKEIMARQTWNADVKRKFDKTLQGAFAAVAPSNDVLRREELSGTARLLGQALFTNPGEEAAGGMGQGYLNARKQKISQYTNYLYAAIKGLSERDLTDVAKHMQLKTPLENIPYAPVRDAVKGVRALTKRYYEYATEKREDGEPALRLEYLGDDHYPRVWDLQQLVGEEGRAKFVTMLLQPKYAKSMEAALTMANEGRSVMLTAAQVAGMMHERLVEKNGVDDKAAESDRADNDVLNPFFASQKERSFKWLDDADVEPFLEKDLVGAMSRYLHQGIRAVEFSRRFGEHGKYLRPLLVMKGDLVMNEETGKMEPAEHHGRVATEMYASLKKAGTTGAEADGIVARHMEDVKNAIAAHEGSLGHSVSPTWRKFSSGAMAYQNLRLLPLSLFAAFGDTIGIAARYGQGGGALAFQAFTQGLKDVYARWKEAASDMPAPRQKTMWEDIAEMVGAVDSHMFLEQMGKAHTSEFMTDFARTTNRALFMANGLTAWDRSMRVSATKAAVLFLQHHASEPDKANSVRWLKELGLKPADIPLDADGKLIWDRHVLAATKGIPLDQATKEMDKVHFAVTRWVEGAVLTPTAGQRPTWASDPHYAVLFHLKQFTYSFQHTILKRAFSEASQGNMNPIGALAAAVPTMIAADMVKGLVVGGGSWPAYMKAWDGGDWLQHGVSRAGLGGVAQFGIDALSDPTSLFGPTVDQVADFIVHPTDVLKNLHNAVPGLRFIKGVPDVLRVAE